MSHCKCKGYEDACRWLLQLCYLISLVWANSI